MRLLILFVVLGFVAMSARGDEPSPDPAAQKIAHRNVEDTDPAPHATLSSDPSWTGVMLLVIGGMFLAAAVIGPIVRANMPEPTPDAHGHDDHAHGHDDHSSGHDAHGHQ